jgi:hypothetical protein
MQCLVFARAVHATMVLAASGCAATTPFIEERTTVLLKDYRTRIRRTFGPETTERGATWVSGQYTVHAKTKGGQTFLERVSVDLRPALGRVSFDLERLGAHEQVRTHLLLSSIPSDRDSFFAQTAEAWVQIGEHPEVHSQGNVPRSVIDPVYTAIERPMADTSDTPETVSVPAGVFEGCRTGIHHTVPLSGVVRSLNGGELRELVEFGNDDSGRLY